MAVHRLVQYLLPSKDDCSHHLVPKTDEQGQATKTLLGKVFGMTGKRREMISLNGSGVDDPQGESLLERMAAGDRGDGEVGSGSFLVGRRRFVCVKKRMLRLYMRPDRCCC